MEEQEVRFEKPQKLDIKSMIREYMSAKGFNDEEIELALAIYESFISGGSDAMQQLIMSRVEGRG